MCGRFTINYTYEQLLKFLETDFSIFDYENDIGYPNYNVSPGQEVLSVIYDGENYRAGTFNWGIHVTHNNKTTRMINARSETVDSLSTFKDSFFNKRCIILASGYYEWNTYNGSRSPYYIHLDGDKYIAFAGIWSKYVKDGKPIYTTSLLTTKPNNQLEDIHHRMPVILDKAGVSRWLNKDTDLESLQQLMKSKEISGLLKYQVSPYVNSTKNNDHKCIEKQEEITLF